MINLKLLSTSSKFVLFFFIILSIDSGCVTSSKEVPIAQVIDQALNFSTKQSLRMAEKYAGQDSILPRSFIY